MPTTTTGFPIAVIMNRRCSACQHYQPVGALSTKFTCVSCGNVEAMSPETWRTTLDVAVLDGPDLMSGEKAVREGDTQYVLYSRTPVLCGGCSQPFDPIAVAGSLDAGKCFCPDCGTPMPIRATPPELAIALPAITHIIGEQPPRSVAAMNARLQGLVVTCPQCAATLPVEQPTRTSTCRYCKASVILPAELWNRIQGVSNEPHPIYLWHDPSQRTRTVARELTWERLASVVIDRTCNLYLLVQRDSSGRFDLASLSPTYETRWVHGRVPADSDSRLAIAPDGAVLLWNKVSAHAIRYSTIDGAEINTIGGPQDAGADKHCLDLRHCKDLVVDSNGTIIYLKHERVVRCAPDGTGIELWAPHKGFLGRIVKEKLHPFFDSRESGSSTDGKDYPSRTDASDICIGWDGHLYLSNSFVDRYDRTGKHIAHADLPDTNTYWGGADAQGNMYALQLLDDNTFGIKQITPDGQVSLHVDGRKPGTPLRDDAHLVVAPDGTTYVLGNGNALRVFSASGKTQHISIASRKDDDYFARKSATRVRQ